VRLINSIQIDPTKIGSFPELEREIREQLESSTRKFEQLKSTIAHLVEYTRDIRGFVDVDLLEEKAGRYRPNIAVVRSLRLTKYVLSTLIYLTKGDPKYIEDMKPAKAFFDARPQLADALRTRKDMDTVLLALYNELPRKFIADSSPSYRIEALLEEILVTRSGSHPRAGSHFYHSYGRQFEESMVALTGAVLRLLFNVKEVETDLDVTLFFIKSGGEKPVRMKRVLPDDVRGVHQKIDHALFLLREAANYVLTATGKDPSFIQQCLNQTFAEGVLDGCSALTRELDAFDLALDQLGELKADTIRLCWDLRDKTTPDVRVINAMMDSSAYRDLLLLARDMKKVGDTFFMHLQHLFGHFADMAAAERIGMTDVLDRLEGTLRTHFSAIDRYLRCVPGLEKKLDAFRRNFGQLTLIEGGQSNFYKTVIHEVSQVAINFTTSTERGKRFHRHLKSSEDLELLFDPLYGDKIRNITEPIMRQHEAFPAQSRFNLGRFTGHDYRDPDVIRNSYRQIVRMGLCADAILDFYGNLLDNGRYMFDASAVRNESSAARGHLASIARFCGEAIGGLGGAGG
jgi:hypothetical protein